MDDTNKRLLNLLQTEVPIVPRPWVEVGERIGGISEAEVMERVQALKTAKIIRQISAIFDTRALGYESSLVAAQHDTTRVDSAAAIVNKHPGVSHNYQRNHAFNLWYTIAVSPDSRLGLARTVQVLHETSGARRTRLLPTLHLFKISVAFDIEGGAPAGGCGEGRFSEQQRSPTVAGSLTELEKQFVREMQCDRAIEPEPFAPIAARLGLSIGQLREMSDAMHTAGRLRRVSAVLRHREIGFTANAMGVWVVPGTDAEILAAGEKMAGFRAVTHCYRRPTYPDWPYNLFTMVHGRTPAECETVLAEISRATGITDYAALYSTKEYKKTRVEYFTRAESEWEARHLAAGTPKNMVG
jgi:DNA-binding Lrp family transcriptional regulator